MKAVTENNLTCEISGKDEKCQSLMGGDTDNPTWEEYINDIKDEWKPHFNLIRKAIEENGMVGELSGNMCNDTAFKFSDGNCICFSWRAWGDLMQAIVGKREGYMAYYM